MQVGLSWPAMILKWFLTWFRRFVSLLATGYILLRQFFRLMVCDKMTKGEMERFARVLQAKQLGIDRSHFFAAVNSESLLRQIREETLRCNRNNVTRTDAYLQVYLASPLLHWALLAHLVSRNGGWNMTDLRGSLLQGVMGEPERLSFFCFLEQCNFLIFQDAYPQLRIFQESVKQAKPLFHLLRSFGVSLFMETAWEEFWRTRELRQLVIAQIINEQSYIEKRVVANAYYVDHVFASTVFNAQSLFHLVSVIFPARNRAGRLAGLFGNQMRDFTSLTERIEMGKVLYAVLFAGRKTPRNAMARFAIEVPHTGSRADYLPTVFTQANGDGVAGSLLYSPTLADAWADQAPSVVAGGDWCTDLRMVDRLAPVPPSTPVSITEAYLRKLEWMKRAVDANGALHS